MNPILFDYELAQHYQNQRQQEANKMRLLNLIKRNQARLVWRPVYIYKSSLNQLGKRLVALGIQLQLRAGVLSSATLSPSDSDCQSELAC